MIWTQHDVNMVRNLITSLKNGKFELDGMEILAFAQMMGWVGKLQEKIETGLKQQEEQIKAQKAVATAALAPEAKEFGAPFAGPNIPPKLPPYTEETRKSGVQYTQKGLIRKNGGGKKTKKSQKKTSA